VSSSKVVVLVRHGETEWSKSGRHTGRTDIPLTEDGRRVARPLKERLAHWSFKAVFTSPMQRAKATAEIAGLGAQAVVRDELTEWNYGDYEGLTSHQIREQVPEWTLWTHGVKGGETAAQIAARVDRMIAEIRKVPGDVAVFSHGHLLRVFAARWVGLAPTEGAIFQLGTAAVSVMAEENELGVIALWNDQSHLSH
jgi:broad specificity phosphatase PhoE